MLARHLRLAGRGLRHEQRPHRRPARRAASRSAHRRRRPATPWPSAASELDANYPGHQEPVHAATGGCIVPATPVLKWDRRPARRLLHGLRQRGRQLHQPPRARQRDPGDDQHACTRRRWTTTTDLRRQPGRPGLLLVRPALPRRAQLRTRPGVDDRQAQGTFIKRSPAVTGLASSDPPGGEITFTWDDYLRHQPGTRTWPQTGEQRPQSAKQYRIEVVAFNGNVIDARSSTRRPTPPSTSSTPRAP